jgi:hypothetical protein
VYLHFDLSGDKRKNANRLIYRLAGEAVNEGYLGNPPTEKARNGEFINVQFPILIRVG